VTKKASAKRVQKQPISKVRAFGKWLWSSLKSQWVATALLIPIGFLAVNTYIAHQDARDARRANVSIERISKVQESGKALDLALASYYQSIAQLGLAERHIRMPGAYADTPIAKAQNDVSVARAAVQTAMGAHAGDVESLRGVLDPAAASRYVSALAEVNSVIDNGGEIKSTGANITVLARLVKARNELVDSALKKYS